MIMNIYIIRHAQTQGNVEKRYLGDTESPLTETGERQQRQALKQLEGVPFDAVYSSPADRTLTMAKAIAGHNGLSVKADARLREMHFGIFDGLTAEEAEAKAPEVWQNWLSDFDHYRLPEGESFQDVKSRFKGFWATIKETGKGEANIACVTHGGIIRAAMTVLCALPDAATWHFESAPATVVKIKMIGDFGLLCGFVPPVL
ncbi:histidine phosphatase family protein [Pseudoramibacter sp.]|jgi:alpha-ribazole phosphatase|uniref:histidine phosphatase family protein n=2 Tax=Pseudoramibacter sp. TaxID=2034862 RepID=UPI0025FBF9BC|nr:histidine phosphatase family protein [Pseudoramibacter sp.]MCH4072536.1 histidine phosphatase family protein [Pseudoramibacter sp.]